MKKNKCCICGKEFEGYGNNPYPIKPEGVCCNACNKFVVLSRISDYGMNVTEKYLNKKKDKEV